MVDSTQPAFFALTLTAATALAVANILERVGLRYTGNCHSLKNPFQFIKALLCNVPWWVGIGLSALGTVGYYAAMGLYNISLVQPLMALNPMLTALLGWRFLHERMNVRIGVAIAAVFLGLVLGGTQAGEAPGVLIQSSLWIFAGAAVILWLLIRISPLTLEVKDSFSMGMGFGLSAVFYKSMVGEWFGGHDGSVWQIVNIRGLLFIGFYGLGFVYSQVGLSRGRALFVIPLSSAVGTLLPILGGVWVFTEPFPMIKMISTGCVLLGTLLFVGGPQGIHLKQE